MKPKPRHVALFLLAALITAPSVARAQSADEPPARPTLTVVEFDTNRTGWAPPPNLGVTLAEVLAARLVSSGQYRVLDREWLTAPEDNSRRTPVQVLRARAEQAGVNYLVLGSLTRFSTEDRKRTFGGGVLAFLGGGGNHRTESVIGVTIRVVDVRSGEVAATATAEGAASRSNVTIGAIGVLGFFHRSPGGAGFSSAAVGSREALLDEALHRAVTAAGEEIVLAAPRLTRMGLR